MFILAAFCQLNFAEAIVRYAISFCQSFLLLTRPKCAQSCPWVSLIHFVKAAIPIDGRPACS